MVVSVKGNYLKIKEKNGHVKASILHAGGKCAGHAIVFVMLHGIFQNSSHAALNLDNVRAVFFDLDGTLIDVDMSRFVPGYLRRLTEEMRELVNPVRATRAMHNAVAAMFANSDAEKTLQQVLLETLHSELSITPDQYADSLKSFCQFNLHELKSLVKGHVVANDLVDASLERGWQVVLATNPIFPKAVVDARVRWGGLDGGKFHYVTTYENAHFCKPKAEFFQETLGHINCDASQCLMIGNDPLHDLAASQTGMQTCLLTPWAVSRPGVGFKADWKGRHQELLTILQSR